MHQMETFNRTTWREPLSLRNYRAINGYLDDGERATFELALSLVDCGRILDLGVGGGRTSGIFKGRCRSYVGIDYTPEMTDIARANYPELQFETMDARDLPAFDDHSFDLVVFSYNGLDSVDPAGRKAIMAEVQRVLAPGGIFVFSSFHRDWAGFEVRRHYEYISWSANPLRFGLRVARYAAGAIRARKRRALEVRDGEHAILIHPAHYFGIMVYATTPAQLRLQLEEAGFAAPIRIFNADGTAIAGPASPQNQYFHIIASKQ